MKKHFKKILILFYNLLLIIISSLFLSWPTKTINNYFQTKLYPKDFIYEQNIENNNIINNKSEIILFSKDIIFNCTQVSDGKNISYTLYTPSCVNEYDKIPLIVWLHGTGQIGVGENEFRNWGLPSIIENWTLEGFNAYVLCPQLSGLLNNKTWNNSTSMGYVKDLLDIFISENNVDQNKIYILGHSLGAVGCLYMAREMPEYFAACVAMCPYYQGFDITEIKIPVMVYVGSPRGGEDEISYRYALKLSDVLGDDLVKVFPTSHGGVPKMAFNLDEDENNRSDLLEWLFSQNF